MILPYISGDVWTVASCRGLFQDVWITSGVGNCF
jgi:hypothetical protein